MLNKTYWKINRSLTDQFKAEFQFRKTNFKRFECLWAHDDTFVQNEIDKLFSDQNCENGNDQKDAQRSASLRKHGNQLFNKIRLNDAILKYNESLKYSPFNDENLSLAYANRSIAFFKLKEYQLCLNDIELALKYNYPRHLLTKLYERKLDCYLKLNRMECAADFVDDLDCEYQQVLARKLDFSFENKNKQHENEVIPERVVFEANESIPSACRKITITNSMTEGNFVRSTGTIEIGETIVNESPYASILLSDYLDRNCAECMVHLEPNRMNITYCIQCTRMTYCSESCQKTSWIRHHSVECKHFELLYRSGLTHMEHLALRIILKTGLRTIVDLQDYLINFEDKHPRECQTIDKNRAYRSDDYLNIFHLVTHMNDRDQEDLLRRTFIAIFLVKILMESNFFDNNCHPNHYITIGGLLLRHLQSISCNAHEINHFKFNKNDSLATCETHGIGAGIYALLSLFNHSCDPSVTRNFNGIDCVVRVLKPIKDNEQIYDNYGVVYPVSKYEERQAKLFEQYFFNCACSACSLKWPLYNQINMELKTIKCLCNQCQVNISSNSVSDSPSCSKVYHLKLLENWNRSFESLQAVSTNTLHMFLNETYLIEAKIIDDYSQKFISYLRFIDEHVDDRPFRDYNNFQEALKQCFNLLSRI